VVGTVNAATGTVIEQRSVDCMKLGEEAAFDPPLERAGIDVGSLTSQDLRDFQKCFGLVSEDFERQDLSEIALLVACLQPWLEAHCYSDSHFPRSDRSTRNRRHYQSLTAFVDLGFDCSSRAYRIAQEEHGHIFADRWSEKTCWRFRSLSHN
jgi:hypothetical protein